MNTKKNGQTKEVSRGRKKRVPIHQREGLGAIPVESESNGTEQSRLSSQDSQGRDPTGSNVFFGEGNSTVGKILKRLELLENAFNSYVGSHRQRLEARLDENKEFVDYFEQEMRLVKEEIYNLAADSNKNEPEP
ncbi:MAG: hypothetical protein KAF91_31155 [Nostoc sp. TH1S01]|nr:hypothetical protein [Nostoc sp. TH1S01]